MCWEAMENKGERGYAELSQLRAAVEAQQATFHSAVCYFAELF